MNTQYTDALERALGRIVADAQAKADLQIARCEALVSAAQSKVAEAELRIAAMEAAVTAKQDAALAEIRIAAKASVDDFLEAKIQAVLADEESKIRATIKDAIPDVKPLIAAEVEKAVAAIPVPRDGVDGKDVDPEVVREMVKAEVALLPAPKDGRDADPEVMRAMLQEMVAAIPAPKDGRDGREPDAETIKALIVDVFPPVETLRGPPGRLPVVKAWEDRVHYDGDVVAYRGATYQALRDTGHAPPHADWLCLAARGADGRSVDVRGTYVEGDEYRELDIVALNGGSFIALMDNPGPCPGDGWQLLASRGKAGPQGVKGERGDRGADGKPGASVLSGEIDADGLLTLTNGDGSTVEIDFYPVLSRL